MFTERARLVLCLAGLGACSQQAIDLTNLACASSGCLDGYVCHPETDLCVPELAVGCADAEAVCSSSITGGASCSAEGAFIPCRDGGAADCSDGCRTCIDGAWSDCSLECERGQLTSCSTCSDDCTESVQNATPLCDTTGAVNVCTYDLDAGCQGTFVNADGDVTNGCECLPSGTDIACNDIDEDCDGADLTEVGTLQHCSACGDSCEGLPHVEKPACVGTSGSYACTIVACDASWANQDNHVANGCENECIPSNGGVESCDGLDNDCNGMVDDDVANCDSGIEIQDGRMLLPSNLGAVDLCHNAEALVMNGGTIDTTDGAITGVASPVSSLVPQTNDHSIRAFFFDSVTINGTVTVSGDYALALVACNELTVNGELNLCASGREGGPGGDRGGHANEDGAGPGAGASAVRETWTFNRGGGGGGSHCGAGGTGGYAQTSDGSATGGSGGQAGVGSATLVPLTGGSGGGGGSDYSSQKYGGGGGGAVQLVGNHITIAGTIHACGGGGGGPVSDGDSGGGAGAGGGILLEAVDVTLAEKAVLAANGGGGGGGDTYDWTSSYIANVDTSGEDGPAGEARALGGEASPGYPDWLAGAGGAGGALTGTDIHGDAGGEGVEGKWVCGGGGGGGAGYIRINSFNTPDIDVSAAISPRDSACFSRGSVSFQ